MDIIKNSKYLNKTHIGIAILLFSVLLIASSWGPPSAISNVAEEEFYIRQAPAESWTVGVKTVDSAVPATENETQLHAASRYKISDNVYVVDAMFSWRKEMDPNMTTQPWRLFLVHMESEGRADLLVESSSDATGPVRLVPGTESYETILSLFHKEKDPDKRLITVDIDPVNFRRSTEKVMASDYKDYLSMEILTTL